jgi:TonB family protein
MNTTLIAPLQSSLQRGISTGMENPTPKKRVILPPAPGKPGTTARFALLPEGKPRFGSLGTSVIVQISILALLVIVPLIFPEKMIPKTIFINTPLATPVTEVPLPPPPAPKVAAIKPKVTPPPTPEPVKEVAVVQPIRQPKILAPKVVAPKVEVKKVAPMDAPKLDAKFDAPEVKLDSKMAEPARPRAPVVTGNLGTGSSAVATLPKNTPPEKVQTGGFGDPNGAVGTTDPNHRANINQRGAMDLPGGPGYGNGTGGATGARGTVASTGFGNGTAIQPPGTGGNGRGGTRAVQSGGFSAAVVEADKPKQAGTTAAAVQPIEITDKPKPEYTAEARALKLEGQVVVAVIFKANGEIVVQNVVQGLGHGLDEMAVKAAQHIKYKPAISNGQPVDFPARVRIEFQLAY